MSIPISQLIPFSLTAWCELPWCFRLKEFAFSVRDLGLIPGLGRSPGEVHGNPL